MARYGNQEHPFVETMSPKPEDPYGIAKAAAEEAKKAAEEAAKAAAEAPAEEAPAEEAAAEETAAEE